jgi:hypothetical protein
MLPSYSGNEILAARQPASKQACLLGFGMHISNKLGKVDQETGKLSKFTN